MLTQASFQAIKSIPIAAILAAHGVKVERGEKACCPIHNENSPSFKIYPKTNTFKCFGCGAGGDGITLQGKLRQLDPATDFIEICQSLAPLGSWDIEFENNSNPEAYRQRRQAQKSLRQTLGWALQKFSSNLLDPASPGLAYLQGRGLTEESIAAWQLGYAPDAWDFLTSHIIGKEDPKAATELGLIRQKEDSGRYYDALRNRIIFPRFDANGEAVSFNSRTLADVSQHNPKSIAGLPSDIYSPATQLYGLHLAAGGIKAQSCAILVEGEMDVIQMHQAGADNTVGITRSLLTPEQVRLLKRFTDHAILMPDIDAPKPDGTQPGLLAVEKNLNLLLQQGFRVSIFQIPDAPDGSKRDPDDYAKLFL